jgi:hypothetical protein
VGVTEGRKATCVYCQREASSTNPHLAFFEYRGEGSPWATENCKACGYHKRAHEPVTRFGNPGVVADGTCKGFQPRDPCETDEFYCGCRGWD